MVGGGQQWWMVCSNGGWNVNPIHNSIAIGDPNYHSKLQAV